MPASSPIVFILPMLALILVPVVGGNAGPLLTAAVAALASHLAWAIATSFRTRHAPASDRHQPPVNRLPVTAASPLPEEVRESSTLFTMAAAPHPIEGTPARADDFGEREPVRRQVRQLIKQALEHRHQRVWRNF